MKCDLPREELIGFLYDEVDAGKKAGIESHIGTCPSCTQVRWRNWGGPGSHDAGLEGRGSTPASLVFAPETTPVVERHHTRLADPAGNPALAMRRACR